eukprot:15342427-Ditylum_brightwellii.AAC.1
MDTAKSFIRTYHTSLNNLLGKLKEVDFDIDAFCNYASKTLETLKDAGGDVKQASFNLIEALVLTSVDTFSSEIRAYKSAIAAKDKQLDFTKLTTIAKTKCPSLNIHNIWLSSPTKSSSTKK